MNRAFTAALFLFSVFLSMPGSASAISAPGPENRVWDFSGDPNTTTRGIGSQVTEAHWVESALGWEVALDVPVGPNLYTYVQQNPWTHFDPLGLYTGEGLYGSGLDANPYESFVQNKDAVSFTTDFVPIVTTIKGVIEAATGRDPITGKGLSKAQQAIAGGGTLASAIPGGKAASKAAAKALKATDNAAETAVEQTAKQSQIPTVQIDKATHPQAAQHIEDAQAAGHPSVLTVDRGGAQANRSVSLKGHEKIPGQQLDEYPPAIAREGGGGGGGGGCQRAPNQCQ